MDPACVISPAEWTSFRRCRRQWDFAARLRRNLEPRAAHPDLDRAIRDTLAVYYFPGMWDWSRSITQPLVVQGLDRALAGQRDRGPPDADPASSADLRITARRLLDRYLAWAPGADRFSPVLVEPEYDVLPDPAEPSSGLLTGTGAAVRYRGRIDLLAVDQYDAYWIVRHRLVRAGWPAGSGGQLARPSGSTSPAVAAGRSVCYAPPARFTRRLPSSLCRSFLAPSSSVQSAARAFGAATGHRRRRHDGHRAGRAAQPVGRELPTLPVP